MDEVEPGTPTATRRGRHLLVWDAPNMDMTLSTVLGGRPTPDTRPSFTAVGRWLSGRAGEDDAEAAVFTNIVPESEARVLPWVTAVRSAGFALFAKPKIDADDDIDDDLAAHVRSASSAGNLAEVIIASHDAAAFEALLSELAATGVQATVLGFMEFAAFALRTSAIEFIDIESIPGVFGKPLPRTNLHALPREGAWFKPLNPLPVASAQSPVGRDRAVEALRSLADDMNGGVLLSGVGAHLGARFPEVDLKLLGYPKLLDAVNDLAHDAGIELIQNDSGHPMIRLIGDDSAAGVPL